ncbi:hypothetical protein D4S03_11585 [bacterium]|nr:MAG: hypothetical protein D4S03_11585 [bacterium]
MAIKLPKEFNKIVKSLNPIHGYNVEWAYFDGRDHTIHNGLQDLRKYLDLTPNDIRCDGWAGINFKNLGSKNILFEGKDSSDGRQTNDAHTQLLVTGKRIYEKYNLKPDLAMITELKLRGGFFEAAPYEKTQLKTIRQASNKKPLALEYSGIFKCPILIGRS